MVSYSVKVNPLTIIGTRVISLIHTGERKALLPSLRRDGVEIRYKPGVFSGLCHQRGYEIFDADGCRH